MEAERIRAEIDGVMGEIQAFVAHQPDGRSLTIEYLYTARKVANCYDRMCASRMGEEAAREAALLRHHLHEYPGEIGPCDD